MSYKWFFLWDKKWIDFLQHILMKQWNSSQFCKGDYLAPVGSRVNTAVNTGFPHHGRTPCFTVLRKRHGTSRETSPFSAANSLMMGVASVFFTFLVGYLLDFYQRIPLWLRRSLLCAEEMMDTLRYLHLIYKMPSEGDTDGCGMLLQTWFSYHFLQNQPKLNIPSMNVMIYVLGIMLLCAYVHIKIYLQYICNTCTFIISG